MIHIPNKAGAAGMMNDMVIGDMQAAFLNVASTAALIKAGRCGRSRSSPRSGCAEYPDVPTIAEAGYPGVGTMDWQSMLAPGATPKDVVATLHKAILDAMQAPHVKDAFKKQLISIEPNASLEEAQAWLKGEIETWKKITDEVKIDLTE